MVGFAPVISTQPKIALLLAAGNFCLRDATDDFDLMDGIRRISAGTCGGRKAGFA